LRAEAQRRMKISPGHRALRPRFASRAVTFQGKHGQEEPAC
jgi:hypothetical protein